MKHTVSLVLGFSLLCAGGVTAKNNEPDPAVDGTQRIGVAKDTIINIPGRATTTLNGKWKYVIDPYETGFYDYRYSDLLFLLMQRTKNTVRYMTGRTRNCLTDFATRK
jgi:hypothetical protein